MRSTCKNCLSKFDVRRNSFGKYCSLACQGQFTNKSKIEAWLAGKDVGYTGVTFRIKRFVRRYLFNVFQSQCVKCGWGETNPTTGNIPLEVNHIDGNPANCQLENLELLYPNCHSLTSNYRNLNKGNSCRNRNGAKNTIRTCDV